MSFGSRSLPPPTAEERARSARARQLGCIACLMDGIGGCGPNEEHHLLVGGVRVGHRYTVILGLWHHQGRRLPERSAAQMVALYGPALKLASRAFALRYGTPQELLDYTDRLLGLPPAVLPTRPPSKGHTARPANMLPQRY